MNTTLVKAISASPAPGPPFGPGAAKQTHTVAKLIDTTTCIGCKACEVACQEWNDQPFLIGAFEGTYQTLTDLTPSFWNLIKFNEAEQEGHLLWLMAKYQCMHCVDPGCLKACPAPGAIVQYTNGIVDFNAENCIGCGYCMTGCPFDVPKLHPRTKKVQKCTLCSDRVSVGLEPACIKACPTNCLSFGTREDLLAKAEARVEALKDEGRSESGIYNPPGVGGTHVVYVLAHADHPENYGLPRDPAIPWTVALWKGPLKWLGNLVLLGGILGTFFHYVRYGPRRYKDETG
ncbi:MAG: formate dehydrogenase subunit beta [Acidobacteria bacterium]|nr:formate dehydrogenase subunit beta [Acidobacteriota bacterium]